MIVDTENVVSGLDLATPPEDAPPAYEAASATPPALDSKQSGVAQQQQQQQFPSTLRPPATALGLSRRASTPPAATSSWFPFISSLTTSRTDKEIIRTVQGLVRDLVKQGSTPDAISILQSCAEACRSRGLLFENVLQESFIEGHTPLYWAILKNPTPSRPPSPSQPQISLVDLLMSFPLKPHVIGEARQACLLNSDEPLFQRLRRSPGCASMSGAGSDELLLGDAPRDEISVENAPGDHGAFKAHLRLPHFQKRMRVTQAVRSAFIARGRIWALDFRVAGYAERFEHAAGTWIVEVGLMEDSPPTFLDSRVSIVAAADAGSDVSIRLRAGTTRLGTPIPGRGKKTVNAALSSVNGGSSLEFDGCRYIQPDGALELVFEAQLTASRTDTDCVII